MIKILILRFSSIGDIVLTTPVIRCLKQQLPNAEIHFFSKKSYSIILENNPYIDRLWLLDGDLKKSLESLRFQNFDYIVDLHNNLRTWRIKRSLNIKSFTFHKINLEKWLYVNFKINLLPEKHIVDRYFEAIKLLDVTNDGQGLDYFIPEKDIVDLKDVSDKLKNGYITFAIGAQHYTKRLPTHKIIEFCLKIKKPIVLLGGKEDQESGDYIVSAVKQVDPNQILINACGKYNLNQSASIIQQSMMVYAHDTGLMHIAAALKKKIISIWGSTVPAFGMYPYQTEFSVIENKNLYCRPCSKIGYKSCPLGHFKCMNDLMM